MWKYAEYLNIKMLMTGYEDACRDLVVAMIGVGASMI